jgi:hypothetical protein
MNIEMNFDVFYDLCFFRRDEWPAACIPDCIFDYAMELLEETGGLSPEYNDPRYIVDNLAANAEWEDFKEFRLYNPEYKNCSDEEIPEIVGDDAIAIFPEEKIILYSLGL